MARLTWFTQPPTNRHDLKFASFYMYDTDRLDFVRIRLELGRTHGSGNAKIICKNNRIVLSQDDNGNFEIIHNNPGVNQRIYDFTIGHHFIHNGNPVTNDEYLPDLITVTELTNLANRYIGRIDEIDLAPRDATEEALVAAIKRLLG